MVRSVFLRPRWSLMVFGGALLLLVTACGVPNVLQSTAAPTPATMSSPAVASASAPVETSTTVSATAATPSMTATSSVASPTAETATTAAPTNTATPVATELPPTVEPSQAAIAPFDPELAAELQVILDQAVADGYIPGAVLSVSLPGQEPWSGASGVADRQQGVPMEPTTNVRIASISKVFTAVVVLQLAQEGRIDLDAPLATYLPDLLPNGNVITVRDLLQHTTGLYDYLEDRNFVTRQYQDFERRWQPAELVAYALQFPPAFAPRTPGAWDYSSTNFVILGMVVEQVSGNSLAQEMRARIFQPLGLEGTFFAPDEPIPGSPARGYSRTVDQTNVAMSFAYATANLVSTAGDVRRFADALVNGELLQPEMQNQMFTFVNGKGQYNMPELEYGLGLMRNRLDVGPALNGQARPAEASRVVGHIGGFGGFRSAVWSAPDSGITIALGVNQAATDPNILATQVFNAILTHQGR